MYYTVPREHLSPPPGFVPYPDAEIEQSIPRRFRTQAKLHADAIALCSDRARYTYTELDRRSNRLAHAVLARRGSTLEPIALMFDHGTDALVAILGTLKAGKCYVILDAGYPADRLRYMLADSGAPLLVTDDANLAFARELAGNAMEVLPFTATAATEPDTDPAIDAPHDSLAAILYTSGSTGRPKGVMHAHHDMLVDVRNLTNGWGLTSNDRWLLHTSLSFANSVRTIYCALMNGGALYLYDSKRKGFGDLPDWINGNKLTVFRTVSTFFRNFLSSLDATRRFPSVRVVSVGGESMLRADLDLFNRHFASSAVLSHAFGPTECLTSCWVLLPHGTTIATAKLPIGVALPDKDILLLDEAHREVADGEIGEIAVRSRYISPGYWRDPERTAAVFLPVADDGSRTYLTGDLGARLPDGMLVHSGRRDFQVKIRGYRVDISEIESALHALPSVADAVVVGREYEPGNPRLIAYVVAAPQAAISSLTLREDLGRVLPDYLIPSSFVILDKLPQTPNGKTDRLRLPEPPRDRSADPRFVAPRSRVEHELAAIWGTVLGIDQVGVTDAFLDLGGDSLQAAQIASRVALRWGVEIPVQSLLASATVAMMAESVVLEGQTLNYSGASGA
jgi:amino acid adenylation domain-containing protein